MKKSILLFSLVTASLSGLSQIDPSDGCAGIPVLPVNTSCVINNYTLPGTYTNGGLVTGSCVAGNGNNRDDGWYSFVATSSDITIEEQGDRNRGLVAWTACGGGTELACDVNPQNAQNTLNLTGLTIGTTYYLQLHRRSGFNGATQTGSICIYETPNPDTPWPGYDLGTLTCASTTSQTGTTSGALNDCGLAVSADHIYQFTTTEITDITIDLCGSSFDTQVFLYDISNGSCGAGALASNDDNCGVQSYLNYTCAPASTYVLVIEGSGGSSGNYAMDISLSNCGCPTPPSNNTPCTALELTVAGSCNYTTGDLTLATGSAVGNPGCANYQGPDVWFYAIAPTQGQLEFSTETVTGGITDGGMAIYQGGCNAPIFISCDDDSGTGLMSQILNTSLTPGDTIFVRVWEYGGNAVGEFDVCARDPSCAGYATNDFCEDPGILTINPGGTFASSTAAVYTADTPDDILAQFCGTIQNNSWYRFNATANTQSFNITSVQGCTNGIQAQVYTHGSTNACCTGFTAVSNCFNPGNNSVGTVTATGLIIGDPYVLMIDGWAGANCDFVISNWSATNILPVEMFNFHGEIKADRNLLLWSTKSESDSKWFIMERSYDGEIFEEIARLDAAGNSSTELMYQYEDVEIGFHTLYYRLKMVDIDLTFTHSKAVRISREAEEISFYPNPSTGELFVSFNSTQTVDYQLVCKDIYGRNVAEEKLTTSSLHIYNSEIMKNLGPGMYVLEIHDGAGEVIRTERIVRQ